MLMSHPAALGAGAAIARAVIRKNPMMIFLFMFCSFPRRSGEKETAGFGRGAQPLTPLLISETPYRREKLK
jgi:hypothetical protein